MISAVGIPGHWYLITRFGEAQVLLPAAFWVALALVRSEATRRLGIRWLQWLGLATLLTVISKVAFIGWGLGVASLNFTGFSGHSMFSAAIYPMLMVTLAARLTPGWQKAALGFGFALALTVGVSRVMVNAHSVSEVVLGLSLGGSAALLAVADAGLPRVTLRFYVPALLVVWMALVPLITPPVPTHTWVMRLAVTLSGHAKPYTRLELIRASRRPVVPQT